MKSLFWPLPRHFRIHKKDMWITVYDGETESLVQCGTCGEMFIWKHGSQVFEDDATTKEPPSRQSIARLRGDVH